MTYVKIIVNWFLQFTATKQTATRHYEKAHFRAGGMAGAALGY